MNDPFSAEAFKWLITILTGAVAGGWTIYDAINLIRTRNADRANPVVRDKHFGYVIGMIIGVVGIIGCLRFHAVL